MIYDSGPWKRELTRLLAALRRRKRQARWSTASFAKLEQEFFYSAYAVRKLVEASKVSDEVEALNIRCTEYRRKGRVPDIVNWQRIEEFYDLSESEPCTLAMRKFCNQIIHSFVFIPCVDDCSSNLAGLFVASDLQKARSILYFDIDRIIELFDAVVQDDIVLLEMEQDPVEGRMLVATKSCQPSNGPQAPTKPD